MIMRKSILFFILITGLSINLFAQSKSISKEEYDSIQQDAKLKLEKQTRKLTTIYTNYANNIVTATRTFEQEFIPPDRAKWLVTEKKGTSVEQFEIIYIGDIEYRKMKDGGWVMRNLKSKVAGNGPSMRSTEDDRANEYSIEKIKVGKETHQILTISTISDQKTVFNVSKIWINQAGLIYKATSKTSITKPENIISESITNYDYNPKDLKIEAPIK